MTIGKAAKDNINFNTILLIVVGALVTVGVKKADLAFEEITRLEQHQEDADRRLGNVESVLGIFTPARKANP